MNKTNTYSTILGGCWREKVVSVFRFGHSKTHFRAPKNGHFCQKCPFSGAQKWDFESLTCEIPFSTFETRSRFLPPYHVVWDRDRDFYLPIMWFEIEIFEIEIFHHWISCFETRSRFFIIESRSSRRDREFSSLNLEIRDEIEMLFISFVNKFQTPEQRAENDISLKKMCIQR